MMRYKKVCNLRSRNKATHIDCDVVFPELSKEAIPFTARPDDPHAHGREIYKQAINGKFGVIVEAPNDTDYFWNGTEFVKTTS